MQVSEHMSVRKHPRSRNLFASNHQVRHLVHSIQSIRGIAVALFRLAIRCRLRRRHYFDLNGVGEAQHRVTRLLTGEFPAAKQLAAEARTYHPQQLRAAMAVLPKLVFRHYRGSATYGFQ